MHSRMRRFLTDEMHLTDKMSVWPGRVLVLIILAILALMFLPSSPQQPQGTSSRLLASVTIDNAAAAPAKPKSHCPGESDGVNGSASAVLYPRHVMMPPEPPQPAPDADGKLTKEQVYQITLKTLWKWGKDQSGHMMELTWPFRYQGVPYPCPAWSGKLEFVDHWIDDHWNNGSPQWVPTVVNPKKGMITLVARQQGVVDWHFWPDFPDADVFDANCTRRVQVSLRAQKDKTYTISGKLMVDNLKKVCWTGPIKA